MRKIAVKTFGVQPVLPRKRWITSGTFQLVRMLGPLRRKAHQARASLRTFLYKHVFLGWLKSIWGITHIDSLHASECVAHTVARYTLDTAAYFHFFSCLQTV